MDAGNHGHWWVKFLLAPAWTEEIDGESLYFKDVWYTEVVQLTCSHPKGDLLGRRGSKARLHATGRILKDFDLDDEKATKDMYWQPVAPPLDDTRDQRPEMD
jgi:hypothetical protein